MSRCCAACNVNLSRGNFSKNQWLKPVGTSRCIECVNLGRSAGGEESARRNDSNGATFSSEALDYPFAQGAFRWVAKGTYTDGLRAGQACVCKWFKTGHVMESTFFDLDIKAMNKALDLVKEWNSRKYVNEVIRVNIPEVWEFTPGSRYAGHKVLQEPFIENYQKFNSNTGWADSKTAWPQLMQALSHFSYHASGGQFVLCDLQGGIYSKGAILTDPVILSRNKSYGVTDLGPQGISSFFSNHRCNQYCKHNWSKPTDRTRYHAVQMGTSMAGLTTGGLHAMPQQHSRPALSVYQEDSYGDY